MGWATAVAAVGEESAEEADRISSTNVAPSSFFSAATNVFIQNDFKVVNGSQNGSRATDVGTSAMPRTHANPFGRVAMKMHLLGRTRNSPGNKSMTDDLEKEKRRRIKDASEWDLVWAVPKHILYHNVEPGPILNVFQTTMLNQNPTPSLTPTLSQQVSSILDPISCDTKKHSPEANGNEDSGVYAVAYRQDMKHLASGSKDYLVRIWDTQTGELLHQLVGHRVKVCAVAYSSDSQYFASASRLGRVILWSGQTYEKIHELQSDLQETTRSDSTQGSPAHLGVVLALRFCPHRSQLASAGVDGQVIVWDVETRTALLQLEFRPAPHLLPKDARSKGVVSFIRTTSQMMRKSSLRSSTKVEALDVEHHQPEHPHGVVFTLAYCPAGKWLATGTQDKVVRLWYTENRYACKRWLLGHRGEVRSVDFSPNGEVLVSGSAIGRLRLWRVATGECLRELNCDDGVVRSVCFCPKGSLLASASSLGMVRVWCVRTGECVRVLAGHSGRVRSLAYSLDGKCLASASEDESVRVWSFPDSGNADDNIQVSGCSLSGQVTLIGHQGRVRTSDFSPCGRYLVTGSDRDQMIYIWDTISHQRIRTLVDGPEFFQNAEKGKQIKPYKVRSLVYSPDGLEIASCWEDGKLRVFDAATSDMRRIKHAHNSNARSVAYTRSGRSVVTGGDDKRVFFWTMSTDRALYLTGHESEVTAVACNPMLEGHLATSSRDGTVRLWVVRPLNPSNPNSAGWQCRHVLEGNGGQVRAICYSACGKQLVSGSHDGGVRLWVTGTGECIREMRARGSKVRALAYVTAEQLVSGSEDGVIYMWDLPTGAIIRELKGNTFGCVWTLAVSPLKHQLACGTDVTKDQMGKSSGASTKSMLQSLSLWTHLEAQNVLVSPSDALACIHLRGGKPDVLLQVLKGRKIEASERLLVTRMRHHGTLLHALIERNYTTALKAVLEACCGDTGLTSLLVTPEVEHDALWHASEKENRQACAAIVDSLVTCAKRRMSIEQLEGPLHPSLDESMRFLLTKFPDLVAPLLDATVVSRSASATATNPGQWRLALKPGDVLLLGRDMRQQKNKVAHSEQSVEGPKHDVCDPDQENLNEPTIADWKVELHRRHHAESKRSVTPVMLSLKHGAGLRNGKELSDTLMHQALDAGEEGLVLFGTFAMRAVVKYKWDTFGRRCQRVDMLWFLLQATLLTFVTLQDGLHWAWGSASFCVTVRLLWIEMLQAKESGFVDYLADIWNLMDLISYALAMGSVSCTFSDGGLDSQGQNTTACNGIMAMGCFANWMRGLKVLRGLEMTSALVRMVIAIALDMGPVLVVMLLAVIAYGTARYALDRQYSDSPQSLMNNIMTAYGTALGDFQSTDFQDENSMEGNLMKLMFIFYTLVQTVLILNLLIALMGDTYERVHEQVDLQSVRQRAELLREYELLLGKHKLRKLGGLPVWLHMLMPADDYINMHSDGGLNGGARWAGVVGSLRSTIQKLEAKIDRMQKSQELARPSNESSAAVKQSELLAAAIQQLESNVMGRLNEIAKHGLYLETPPQNKSLSGHACNTSQSTLAPTDTMRSGLPASLSGYNLDLAQMADFAVMREDS